VQTVICFANTRGLFYLQTEDDLMCNDSKIFIFLVAPTLVMESELIATPLDQIRFVT